MYKMRVSERNGPGGVGAPRGPDQGGKSLIQRSLVHPKRTVFVYQRLLAEIAKLTGIEYRVLSSAFAGEEKNLALEVMKKVVTENPQDTPEEWQRHVLRWAKENSSGEYRPGYWDGYELT